MVIVGLVLIIADILADITPIQGNLPKMKQGHLQEVPLSIPVLVTGDNLDTKLKVWLPIPNILSRVNQEPEILPTSNLLLDLICPNV